MPSGKQERGSAWLVWRVLPDDEQPFHNLVREGLPTIRGVEPQGQSHEGMRNATVRWRSPRSAFGQGREVGTTSGVLEWQHGDPEAFPQRGPRQSLCQLACCRNPWLHLAAAVGSLFSLGSISIAAESAEPYFRPAFCNPCKNRSTSSLSGSHISISSRTFSRSRNVGLYLRRDSMAVRASSWRPSMPHAAAAVSCLQWNSGMLIFLAVCKAASYSPLR